VPTNIRKYISTIVLAPFDHPYQELFNKRRGKSGAAFASADYGKRQITIYPIPAERSVLKNTLAEHLTLSHEAGHIIDASIQPPEMGFFAYTPRWSEAMCKDSKVERARQDLPQYMVSANAEQMKSLREDFADSVMYFSDEGGYKEFLKENFPNRYKLLEELIDDKRAL